MVIVTSHAIAAALLYRQNPRRFHSSPDASSSSTSDSADREKDGEIQDEEMQSVTLRLLNCDNREDLGNVVKNGLKSYLPVAKGGSLFFIEDGSKTFYTVEEGGTKRRLSTPTPDCLWNAYTSKSRVHDQLDSLEGSFLEQLKLGTSSSRFTSATPVLCSPVIDTQNENVFAVLVVVSDQLSKKYMSRLSWLEKQIAACYNHIQRTFQSSSHGAEERVGQQLIRLCGELYDTDAAQLQLKVIKYLEDQTQAECGFLLLVVPDTQELFCQVIGKKILTDEVRFPSYDFVQGEHSGFSVALETKQPIHLEHIPVANRKGIEDLIEMPLQSLLCVPVTSRSDNNLIALACLVNKRNSNRFSDRDISCIHQCFRYTSTVLTSTLAFQNERKLKDQTQAMLQVARHLFTNLGELIQSHSHGVDDFPVIQSRSCEVNVCGHSLVDSLDYSHPRSKVRSDHDSKEWQTPFRCTLQGGGDSEIGIAGFRICSDKDTQTDSTVLSSCYCTQFPKVRTQNICCRDLLSIDELLTGENIDNYSKEEDIQVVNGEENVGVSEGYRRLCSGNVSDVVATPSQFGGDTNQDSSPSNKGKHAASSSISPEYAASDRLDKLLASPFLVQDLYKTVFITADPGKIDDETDTKGSKDSAMYSISESNSEATYATAKSSKTGTGDGSSINDYWDRSDIFYDAWGQYSQVEARRSLSDTHCNDDSFYNSDKYERGSVRLSHSEPSVLYSTLVADNENNVDTNLPKDKIVELFTGLNASEITESNPICTVSVQDLDSESSHSIVFRSPNSIGNGCSQDNGSKTNLFNPVVDISAGDISTGSGTQLPAGTVITTVSDADIAQIQAPYTNLTPIHTNDLTKLLREIMQQARNLTHAERCSVFLIDDETDELVAKVFDGRTNKDNEIEEIRLPITQGIAGHVATSGELLNIKDAYSHPLFYRGIDDSTGFRTRNILCFPIKDEKGRILGVAQLCNKKMGPSFTTFDQELATAFGIYCCISISHSLMYKKVIDSQVRNHLANELMMYHMKCLMYKKLEESQRRKSLANELMIYHMQVNATDVESLSRVDIPHPRLLNADFVEFTYSPRTLPEPNTPLSCLSMFEDLGFISRWRIRRETLAKFLLMVMKGYRNPPYHNWMHAYTVAQFCYQLVKNLKLEKYLEEVELFALFVSCLCHDIDHRGTNNTFQSVSKSVLAALYSSEGSVLERHHFAQTMCILNTEGCNVFENLNSSDYQQVLDLMRDIILATDLAHHFKIMKYLQSMADKGFSRASVKDRKFLLCLLMTSCDLSDQTKPWSNTKTVAAMIYKEFFSQGDMEKAAGYKVAEMYDREKAQIPELQIGFLEHVAVPAFRLLGQMFPPVNCLATYVDSNKQHWEKISNLIKLKRGGSCTRMTFDEVLAIEHEPGENGQKVEENQNHIQVNGDD